MPEILTRAATEDTLLEIVKQWRTYFKWEANEHDIQVKIFRDSLTKSSGMSKNGSSMLRSIIPFRILRKCIQVFGENFWNERKNHKLFEKVYRKAKVVS